jgi:integrase
LDGAALSPITRRGYRYDYAAFVRWCGKLEIPPLPADLDTISLYAVDLLSRGRKTSTVARAVAGVAWKHREEGHPAEWGPRIQQLLRGSRRMRRESLAQSAPLTVEDIRVISASLKAIGTPLALRDRALMVAGFVSALRSNSLVALELEDVEFEPQGAIVHVRHEKTYDGRALEPRMLPLAHGKHPDTTCPVACLREWIGARGSFAGKLFCHCGPSGVVNRGLHAGQIRRIVKRSLARVGRLDEQRWGGHSLRAGLATAAYEGGCPELVVAAQTGHRNLAVLRRYFRRNDLFRVTPMQFLDM